MKTEELTPKQIQAIRIAVAEVAGWKDIAYDMILIGTPPEEFAACREPAIWSPDDGNHLYEVPNYPESLDAVHEAWLTLLEDEKVWFQTHLQDVLIEDGGDGWLICASATQRCIALLRTRSTQKWLEIQNLKD